MTKKESSEDYMTVKIKVGKQRKGMLFGLEIVVYYLFPNNLLGSLKLLCPQIGVSCVIVTYAVMSWSKFPSLSQLLLLSQPLPVARFSPCYHGHCLVLLFDVLSSQVQCFSLWESLPFHSQSF